MLQCLLIGTDTSSDLSLCCHEQPVEETLTLLWCVMKVQVRRQRASVPRETFTCTAFISGKLQFILLHASFIIILRRATGGRDQHQWFCLPKARVRCILKHWRTVLSLFSPRPWFSKGLQLGASVSVATNWPNPPDVSWKNIQEQPATATHRQKGKQEKTASHASHVSHYLLGPLLQHVSCCRGISLLLLAVEETGLTADGNECQEMASTCLQLPPQGIIQGRSS